jgi:uncharacterized protein YciI
MFALVSRYTRPIEEVDALLERHREWIRERYESGHFLVSGRQADGSGGVIVARAASRGELDALLAEDPYRVAGVAEYAVHEFRETDFPIRSAGADAFLSTPTR